MRRWSSPCVALIASAVVVLSASGCSPREVPKSKRLRHPPGGDAPTGMRCVRRGSSGRLGPARLQPRRPPLRYQVRRKHFELFYYSHYYFMVVWIVMLWHAASAWYYIVASLSLWVLDRAIRFSRCEGKH